MSKAFNVLSGALDEAIADAESTEPALKHETVSLAIEPIQSYTAADIKAIRHNTGLTQGMLAKWFGVSTNGGSMGIWT